MNFEEDQFARQRKNNLELSLVPMINVVFLLLIFFLVVGTAAEPDVIEIDIPQADMGKSLESPEISIILSKDGTIIYNNREVTEEILNLALATHLQQNPNQEVTIKADASLYAPKFIKLLRKILHAGGTNLSIATITQ